MTYSDNQSIDPKVLARIVEILRGLPEEFYNNDYSKRTIAVAIQRIEREFSDGRITNPNR